MLKHGKKFRKKLAKLRSKGTHDFIHINKGFKVDGITQCQKLDDRVIDGMIHYYPLPFLKNLVVVEK